MTFSTAQFLREQRDEIVRVWEASVAEESQRIALTGSVLRDHVPELVSELADWMETANERDAGPPMNAASVAHSASRLEHGFELGQLIHEVRLLRNAILSLLLARETTEQEGHSRGMATRVVELARLNMGLDFAIAEGVEWFVEERERRLLTLANREIQLAREADRRKSDFLAVLSHELRNPLAPILNGLHIIDRAEPGSEPARRAREIVHRQTRHLTKLVDDLLDTTRLAHGKIDLHREHFELKQLASATFDDHREIFARRGVAVSLEMDPAPASIHGDPIRIAQILSNLMQNAAKFTPTGGQVSVAVHTEGGYALLRIRDNGVGMERDALKEVFEPFVQGRQNIARQQGGLGLGLALVKGLIELHGGSVSARSAGVGRGSEFIVTLPLAPASPPTTPAPLPEPGQREPRLILIIEDNIDGGDALAQMLELWGHQVHIARDGESGIALASDLKPDIVLCDLGLPDIDGYAVARALRADGSLHATRLIALTGYAQPDDRQRVLEAGFDAHLAKPVPLDELDELLGRRI
jgi:two-component system CheB/CheR fusion protein